MIDTRKLKEGDKLLRTYTGISFLTAGKEYTIIEDGRGLHIIDDDGDRYDINSMEGHAERWELVTSKYSGEVGRVIIEESSFSRQYGEIEYTMTVRMDEAGMRAITALAEQSRREDRLREHDEKIRKAEALLERLKEERESI